MKVPRVRCPSFPSRWHRRAVGAQGTSPRAITSNQRSGVQQLSFLNICFLRLPQPLRGGFLGLFFAQLPFFSYRRVQRHPMFLSRPLSEPLCREGELDAGDCFPSVPIVLGSVSLRDGEVQSAARLL